MKAYIKWNKFEKGDEEPESGKDYLIAYGCKKAQLKRSDMQVATFYHKGDKVMAEVPEELADEPKTPEEKLLVEILGCYKKAEIYEDGFYVMSGDLRLRDAEYEKEGFITFPVFRCG